MDYKKIYNQLIEKRKANLLTKDKSDPSYVYCETHHVKMKTLGGSDEPSNLVNLLPREHAIAHLLILKIAIEGDNKNEIKRATCALRAFQNLSSLKRNYQVKSRLYEKMMMHGRPMLESTKKKLSKARKGIKWTDEQRKKNQAYHQHLRDIGVKLVPWNKGVPLSQKTKKKMKRTLKKLGNKNIGRKASNESKVKECKTRLSNIYPNVSFDGFDFKAYVAIPRHARKEGRYLRHEFLENFLLKSFSKEKSTN